jgi:hypothetical protein
MDRILAQPQFLVHQCIDVDGGTLAVAPLGEEKLTLITNN